METVSEPLPTVFAALVSLTPRALRRRVDTFRRDFQMVRAGLAGERPAPFTSRRPLGVSSPSLHVAAAPAPGLSPRKVRVERIERETADAVSLHLVDPTGAPFAFTPGQFLTVVVKLEEGGENVRRAYSISSSAESKGQITITTKRVEGGRVSGHINERIREGDILSVLGPSGAFTLAPSPEGERHVILLAGGSGITPMMSILRSVLALEPKSRVSLIYGNRGRADVIFHSALAELAKAHGRRFDLRHVLAQTHDGHDGGVGLLDRAAVARELDALGDAADDDVGSRERAYYICGPEPMMVEARAALLARGVAESAIHEERFTQPHLRAKDAHGARVAKTELVTIRLAGRAKEIAVAPGQTVLEAGLDAGLDMPFSCAMGGCGACMVTVVSGEIEMEEPNCLTPAERARGCALACVGRPVGAAVVEVA